MRNTPLLALLTLALSTALLTACDNPSPVGLDLIDEQGGDPTVTALTPDVLAPTTLADVTGNTPRTLAGRVEDPALGTFTAVSHLDIGLPTSGVREEYTSGTVERATLLLQPDYRYGDTTATLTLAIRDLVDEWNELGTTADTSISTGALITEVTFLASDTLVEVPLPAAWVEPKDAQFRTLNTLQEAFHGFQLAPDPAGGNAVVGFNANTSALRVYTAADSATFPIGKTLTTLAREGAATVPANRLLLQDGTDQRYEIDFDFIAKGLADAPLNRASLRFSLDAAALDATLPPHFVRPRPEAVTLFGITDDLTRLTIEDVGPDSSGRLVFSSNPFRSLIQGILLGTSTIERLELGFPVNANSLSPLLLYDMTTAETAPTLVLTTIPTE